MGGQVGTSSPTNYIFNMTNSTSSPTNPLFFSSSPTNYPLSTPTPTSSPTNPLFFSSSPTNYPLSTPSPSKKSKASDKSSKSFTKSSKGTKSPKKSSEEVSSGSKKSKKSDKSSRESFSPVSAPIADECIVCSNNPIRSMTKKAKKEEDSFSCEDYGEILQSKCNKHKKWIKEKYCQLSCYLAGNGYEGDVCCLND